MKLADFTSEANLVSIASMFFFAKYLTGHRYFILKTVVLLQVKKKINTRLAFMYYPNGKEMDQMIRNGIACNCIPLEKITFW